MLTAKRVERTNKPGRYRDGMVPGLLLQISESGAKSWVLRYELNGRERMMGLGPVTAFNLKEARDRARFARQLLADGIDPLARKQEAKRAARLAAEKALTFKVAAQRYFDQHQSKWSSRSHRDQFLSTLEAYAFGPIGDMDVAAIALPDILRCIEPHWTDKAVTMDRIRTRIEAVLDWAAVRGYRQGDNPARWKGHLDQVLPAPRKVAPIKNFASVPYAELPSVVSKLQADEPSVAAWTLLFLILTTARSGEVLGARWSEIDLANAVWTVPASRMKARREHRVPLSAAALDILHKLPREDDLIFIGPRPGYGLNHMALTRVMQRLERTETVHGFRSSFRTWAAEQTNIAREIAERSLAHVTGTKTEQAYERSDLFNKRRKLMEAWARHCTTPTVGTSRKVVPMRKPAV